MWIALFRGINVGGRNTVPMKRLADLLTSIHLRQVQTYIQSGNVIFESDLPREFLEKQIQAAMQSEFGFAPEVMLLTGDELHEAGRNNPFPEAEATPKLLHLLFMNNSPAAQDIALISAQSFTGERAICRGKVLYLHLLPGMGQSNLAEFTRKNFKTPTTARNWNTVLKLMALSLP